MPTHRHIDTRRVITRHRRAFTFVEIVVVAVIILILSAIAIPNYLEARIRARVSRDRADLAAVAVTLESYRIDHHAYPPNRVPRRPDPGDLVPLTTPVAYLTRLPLHRNERATQRPEQPANYLHLGQIYTEDDPFPVPHAGGYALYALYVDGPDAASSVNLNVDPIAFLNYDPTNGTVSSGDLIHFGP